MSAAELAFAEAFGKPRDPRSPAYKAGVMAVLVRKLDGGAPLACPFEPASAECDAWYSGVNEGHSIVAASKAAA